MDRYLITKDLSRHVLTVGIDYKKPRGGIAAVLSIYAQFIERFKFVRSTVSGNKVCKALIMALCYCRLLWIFSTDKDIKIVHIHASSDASFWRKRLIVRLAKRRGKKVIFHCHSGRFADFRLRHTDKVDTLLRMCDVVVALSAEWKEYFESIGCRRVVIIKNVIAPPTPADAPRDGKIHLLFLGLISRNKGIYDIVEVIGAHQAEWRGKITLHIGGNGEIDTLMSKLKETGIEDIARFEGWVDREKKRALLNGADIYICPSYREGVPVAILEAMSYRKPIITTPAGGIPSIVTDGVNGLLVEAGNKEAIYEAITKLVDNPALCRQMGNAGYDISREYWPEVIAEQLKELYMSLLS